MQANNRVGKALSAQNVKLKIPARELLKYQQGNTTCRVSSIIFFAKIFWNDDFRVEDNAVINYDWYHPQDCTKHTLEEVREWFKEAGLIIVHGFVDFYGITIRGNWIKSILQRRSFPPLSV